MQIVVRSFKIVLARPSVRHPFVCPFACPFGLRSIRPSARRLSAFPSVRLSARRPPGRPPSAALQSGARSPTQRAGGAETGNDEQPERDEPEGENGADGGPGPDSESDGTGGERRLGVRQLDAERASSRALQGWGEADQVLPDL